MNLGNAIKNKRIDSLDLAKGTIMVLMAIDHASALTGKLHWSEYWGGMLPDYANSVGFFLTRFITHLCAPGFFFFMGIGIVFTAARASADDDSAARIRRHFLIRGALLLLIQQLIENPAWLLGFITAQPQDFRGNFGSPGDNTQIFLHFGVLSALGVALMISGWLHSLRTATLAILGIGLIGFSLAYVSVAEGPHTVFPFWQQFLLTAGHARHVNVMYPIIQWLGVTCLGMAFGKQLLDDPQRCMRDSLRIGAMAILGFIAVRLAPIGDSTRVVTDGLIGFLTVTKYPPSIEFIALTLGLNLIILHMLNAFAQTSAPILQALFTPLRLFGRTALFFYIAHLYIYAVLGLIVPAQLSLANIYLAWFSGLIPLYFLCRAYLKFKTSRPKNSWWRYF